MSDWHIKNISDDGRKARVVFHIPVPAGNNSASPVKTWQECVSEFIKTKAEDGSWNEFFSDLENIGAELTDLRNGSLFEVVETVRFAELDNNAEKKTKIDNEFTATVADVQSRLAARLRFWGYASDV